MNCGAVDAIAALALAPRVDAGSKKDATLALAALSASPYSEVVARSGGVGVLVEALQHGGGESPNCPIRREKIFVKASICTTWIEQKCWLSTALRNAGYR